MLQIFERNSYVCSPFLKFSENKIYNKKKTQNAYGAYRRTLNFKKFLLCINSLSNPLSFETVVGYTQKV